MVRPLGRKLLRCLRNMAEEAEDEKEGPILTSSTAWL